MNAALPSEEPALGSSAKKGEESDQSFEITPDSPLICGLKRGERAAGCGAEGAAPAPAALPRQNSNNSDRPEKRYRLQPFDLAQGLYTSKDNKHAVFEQREDGLLQRFGLPSPAEAKAAFHLGRNVFAFCEHWGRNHCLFFTITDEDNLHPTQFARRWNNYLRRQGAWIVSFIRVLEPQKRGAPHYHLLVAVPWDTQPDRFDWPAFLESKEEFKKHRYSALFRKLRACYVASAAPELVILWSSQRKVLRHFRLRRAELLPLRKDKEAISEYVGKYLEGGLAIRLHRWKGCRRVEFDRRAKNAWLACTRVFSWHSPGAIAWRARVGQIAAALGVGDTDGIRRKLGSKWAYRLREAITLSTEEDWNLFLSTLSPSLSCL
jgi:hypothetical protein